MPRVGWAVGDVEWRLSSKNHLDDKDLRLKLQSHWDADWHAARGLGEIAEIGNPRQTVSNRVFSSARCAYTPRRTKNDVHTP